MSGLVLVLVAVLWASLAAFLFVLGFFGRDWFQKRGMRLRVVVLAGAAAAAILTLLTFLPSAISPAAVPISPTTDAPPLATQSCVAGPDVVTVYVDPDLRGECRSFDVGEHELGDLARRVSSVLDPGDAFSWVLYDATGRPGRFDETMRLLPADWNDLAIRIKVERHAAP